MPNIKEYDAGNLTLNPTDKGTDAAAAAGRRIGGFYNQVAQGMDQVAASQTDTGNRIGSAVSTAGAVAVKYEDHREISQGAATFAQLTADLTDKRNAWVKNADPNDPSVISKFNEQVLQPALDNFQSAFNTENAQQWAEGHADALRTHMFQQNSADLSTMAAEAVSVNIKKSENAWTNTARSDPSSTNFLLEQAEHSVGAIISSSPALSASDAAKVRAEGLQKTKEAIVKAGALGTIEKAADPEKAATDFASRYPDYINGVEVGQLAKAAQVQNKANLLTDKQTQETNTRLADQKAHAAGNKTFTDNVTIDPITNMPTVNPRIFKDALDIARNNPNAPQAATIAKTLTDWGESQLNKERKVTTDPTVASSIDSRMFTSDNPTSKMDILQAEAAGKLTRSDAEIRTKIIDQRDKMPSDPQFKLAMDGAKELIEGRTAGEKSLQSGKYASFMQQFLEDYQRQKAAGTLPANALSLRDPKSLLSQTMESYKSPLAAAISGNGGVTAAPSPSIPAPATTPNYKEGDVVQTSEGPRRFKGGSYRDKKNWEPVS